MRPMHLLALSLIPLFCAPGPTTAAGFHSHREEQLMNSYAFLYAHPDVKFRKAGLAAYEAGLLSQAAKDFRRAARFADKPSQAMLAEMLWRGEGVPQDRPAAYAWMDLAAERGFKTMLVKREIYWNALTASERKIALDVGAELYAEFGDEIAKERLERKLRRATYERTGSNVGFVGNLDVTLNVDNEPVKVDGASYYERRWWQPELYWALQDAEWQESRGGLVEIGPLTAPTTEEEARLHSVRPAE